MKIAKSINSNGSYAGVFNNAFGMQLPNRQESVTDFRYGFNGMESDDEIKGIKNSYDFGARMYDSRVGRFLSRDPSESDFPWQSTYAAFNNDPTVYNDPTGKSGIVTIEKGVDGNPGTIKIQAHLIFYGTESTSDLAVSQAKQIQKLLSENVTEMMVNGEMYKVEFEITGEHKSYSQTWKYANDITDDATSIPNGTADVDYGIDERDNYIRLEATNSTLGEYYKLQGKEGGELISSMGTSSDAGSNSGFWILSGITGDPTEAMHEFLHGLNLQHKDSDMSASFPDGMVASNTPASNFPNMDVKYIGDDGMILSSGNLKPTADNLMKAFQNNGYTVNENGLQIDFNSEGKFEGTLGKANNRIYNQGGEVDSNFNAKDPARDN